MSADRRGMHGRGSLTSKGQHTGEPILRVATTVIETRGVAAITLEDNVRSAGEQFADYHYFGHRDSLILAAIHSGDGWRWTRSHEAGFHVCRLRAGVGPWVVDTLEARKSRDACPLLDPVGGWGRDGLHGRIESGLHQLHNDIATGIRQCSSAVTSERTWTLTDWRPPLCQRFLRAVAEPSPPGPRARSPQPSTPWWINAGLLENQNCCATTIVDWRNPQQFLASASWETI